MNRLFRHFTLLIFCCLLSFNAAAETAPTLATEGNILIFLIVTLFLVLFVLFRQKQNQKALQSHYQGLETLLAAAPDLMLELNLQGHCLALWGGAQVSALTALNLRGNTVRDVLPQQAADAILRALAEAEQNGHSFGCEIKLDLAQGEHWLDLSVAKQARDAALPAVFTVIVRDISQRKRNELQVQKSEERLRLLLENTPIALRVTLTNSNQVIFANQCYGKLLGSLYNIGLDPIHIYANPKDYEEVREQLARGKPVTNKLIKLRSQEDREQEKWVLASYLVVEFEGERAILSWYYDISQRMRSEKSRLLQMEVQRNALVREVHHRIKNNLQGIIGLLNLEAEKHPVASDVIASVSTKLKSVAVVFGLQGQRSDDAIYLHEVIDELCKSAQNMRDIPLDFQINEFIHAPVLIDKNKAVAIALIINELITNAIKHNSGGPIRLVLSVNEASASCLIANHCLNPTTKLNWQHGRGLGTGLNLVKLLLPTEAARLAINFYDGCMNAELTLDEPIILRKIASEE